MLFEISAAINEDERATIKLFMILKIAIARSSNNVKESEDFSAILDVSIFDKISSLDRETIDAESSIRETIPKDRQI